MLEPLADPFFATMRDGLVAAAREGELPISVDAAVGLQDTAGQASALESLAEQRAACYILNPIDQTNLVPSLPAIPSGTPIVNVESRIDRAYNPHWGSCLREGNENLVRLTESAGAKVRALIAREQQGNFLRIAINGGGCNGLSYKLRFVAEPKRGDIMVRTADVERAVRCLHAAFELG